MGNVLWTFFPVFQRCKKLYCLVPVPRQGSDIDIAVKGTVSKDVLSALLVAFDETVLPYFVDIVVYDHIKNIALKEHIDRVGICIYSAL
mgnify:CR=1 FL=1